MESAALAGLRRAAGMTQADLAEELKTSTTYVSQLERGERHLASHRWNEIAPHLVLAKETDNRNDFYWTLGTGPSGVSPMRGLRRQRELGIYAPEDLQLAQGAQCAVSAAVPSVFVVPITIGYAGLICDPVLVEDTVLYGRHIAGALRRWGVLARKSADTTTKGQSRRRQQRRPAPVSGDRSS